MDVILIILSVLLPVALVGGLAIGYLFRTRILTASLRAAEKASTQQISRAEGRRREILTESKREALKIQQEASQQIRADRIQVRKREERLEKRELDVRRRSDKVMQRDNKLNARAKDLERRALEVEEVKKSYVARLDEIAKLTEAEARSQIIEEANKAAEVEIAKHYRSSEKIAAEEADGKARRILAESIQRFASEVVADVAVTTVKLPNNDMKGRLIGREGRNIKAIEKATGVELLVDDSPDTVVLSSFDPVRREVARLSVEKLMRDGRIQPARIEETVIQTRKTLNNRIRKIGEDACFEIGLKLKLPGDLNELMGSLQYRTSFGSNVLKHSKEVGTLAALLASEIGANVENCRLAGFLHDIGKAVTHEVQGGHAEIGADIVQKTNLARNPVIVTAIREHHDREMTTVESFIVAAADAISAARPGARNDSAEKYLERMRDLESIGKSFDGVENCFALQAGREVRVMVNPNGVNDDQALTLARDIAKEIEDKLSYPGEIKIVVIRELRAFGKAS